MKTLGSVGRWIEMIRFKDTQFCNPEERAVFHRSKHGFYAKQLEDSTAGGAAQEKEKKGSRT
jgi:hypothetical protein